jgi:hypothetical protein
MLRSESLLLLPESSKFAKKKRKSAVFSGTFLAGSQEGHFEDFSVGNQLCQATKITVK